MTVPSDHIVPTVEALLQPILNAPAHKPFVIAQLGQSLDGRIATPTGESRWINRDCALDHVHRLRASVDAVVVGIGTVIADDPILNVRRAKGPNPARVVIDPKGRLPANPRLAQDDGARTLVIRSTDAPATEGPHPKGPHPKGMEIIRLEGTKLDPNAIVAALFARGLKRLLIEGGAWTISEFIDADAVDRLHVLVAPVILGSGKTGLSLKPIEKLIEAKRPQTRVHVLPDGDVIFDCNLRLI
jgi:diaminohydroxyphosphoribosylaminopyrimidine deaminase / 5-amino-6-(5-phosphoribosylamino)uracil reductase